MSTMMQGPLLSQWNKAVEREKASGKDNQSAVIAANRNNPGLREKMLEEVNAGRRRR